VPKILSQGMKCTHAFEEIIHTDTFRLQMMTEIPIDPLEMSHIEENDHEIALPFTSNHFFLN